MVEEKIKEQILSVRNTGLTNMFDVIMVLRLAFEHDYYELVCWLENHKKEYIHFIIYGEE